MEKVAERLYVPPLPTLWPSMLAGRGEGARVLPFASPSARYFYFARNAVWLTVKMLGLDGGEVLVPAYHHGVEVEALVDAGAAVTFYRVGPRWNVDVDDVRRKISPRTRALYLIHYAGFPGPTDELRALADEHGIPLIEDCALSLLSCDGDRPLGSTGDVGIFCLYKTLPVPNGGALVVNGARSYAIPEPPPPPWASTLSHTGSALLANLELRAGSPGRTLRSALRRLLRGTANGAGVERVATGTRHFERQHVDLGMSTLTRRIAQAQDFARIAETRRRNYFFLLGRLREVSTPLFNELGAGVCPLFYPLQVADKAVVMARLAERGIETVDFWRHFHPACEAARYPEVARLRRTIVEIPCHQDLDPDAMQAIATAVREALVPPKAVKAVS
jgi:perosamine synthetase